MFRDNGMTLVYINLIYFLLELYSQPYSVDSGTGRRKLVLIFLTVWQQHSTTLAGERWESDIISLLTFKSTQK